MVIFGLFHGLIFLPALLATMGPRAYTHAGEEEEEQQVRDSPKKKTFYPFQMCLFFDRKHRKQLAEAAPETRKRKRRSCSTWRTEDKIEGEQIEYCRYRLKQVELDAHNFRSSLVNAFQMRLHVE